MKKIITNTLLILCISASFAQNQQGKPLETTSLFEVQVDADTYTVEEGSTLDIDGKLKDPKISIKLLDIKRFNAGNISFEYPSNFSFEYEESEGYKNWTLDGNDFVIMIFDVEGKTTVKEFIDNMIIQFGEENCITKTIKSRLGEKIINGIQLAVELAGHRLTIDFYKYSTSENNSRYIAFQDTLEEDGTATNEAVTTFKMINDTIRYE